MNLTKTQWQKIGGVVITALLMIASIAGWYFPVDAPAPPPNYVVTEEEQAIGAQASKERVTRLIAKKLTVLAGGAEFQSAVDMDSTLNVDGAATLVTTLSVGGASTLTGAVDAQGDLTIDDTLNIDDTASTIVGTQTLTPTTTFYTFAPASVLTLTLSTGSAETGDLLIVANIVATTTTVVDTTCTIGGSAITLGDGDNATFLFYDSKWCQISGADNS